MSPLIQFLLSGSNSVCQDTVLPFVHLPSFFPHCLSFYLCVYPHVCLFFICLSGCHSYFDTRNGLVVMTNLSMVIITTTKLENAIGTNAIPLVKTHNQSEGSRCKNECVVNEFHKSAAMMAIVSLNLMEIKMLNRVLKTAYDMQKISSWPNRLLIR